ncbi:DNA-3-methyladenine glycosylase family protein [Martelella soudanensis]|uniref:DNA-3-methyladenine glycosylase family protein n=1 Tax=unclassified Martelella TaxID=2629616 RepID=UPI0015DDF15E|nr:MULTISPECIES: DNA-3-methyladenine glycosylase 2 family protein [unclassified Martelella]
MQRLRNGDDLQKALAALCENAPLLARLAADCPEIPLRLLPPGFAGLAEVITGQMISKRAAAAIFARLEAACDPLTAESYLALAPEILANIGLTRAKQATLDIVARAIDDGRLDLAALETLQADEGMKLLTTYRGIGAWTAEVYLMFCAGHADIFPAGDLALRIAASQALGKSDRIEAEALRAVAREWQPYRSVAARILWAHYARITKRDVLPVG